MSNPTTWGLDPLGLGPLTSRDQLRSMIAALVTRTSEWHQVEVLAMVLVVFLLAYYEMTHAPSTDLRFSASLALSSFSTES